MSVKKKKKGFTLIELVIVIAIIAILAAIAIPRYQKSKEKARDVAKDSNISMLTTAAVLKQSEMGENDKQVIWKEGDVDKYKDYIEQWPHIKGKSHENDEGNNGYVVKISPDIIIINLNGDKIYDSQEVTTTVNKKK